jgi:hypothetical protein
MENRERNKKRVKKCKKNRMREKKYLAIRESRRGKIMLK